MPPINLYNVNQVYLLSFFDAVKALSNDKWLAFEGLA